MARKQMAAPINVLVFRRAANVTTSTENSLYRLPQSTVAVIVCRNCSNVANLKQSKLGIVHLLPYPGSLAPEREKCCDSHPYVGNYLGMIIFIFERNFDLPRDIS